MMMKNSVTFPLTSQWNVLKTLSLSLDVRSFPDRLPPPPPPSSPFSTGFGRKDVVEHLLQTGANVHARDDGGLIPLHNACSFGHSEVRESGLSSALDCLYSSHIYQERFHSLCSGTNDFFRQSILHCASDAVGGAESSH